MKKDYLDNVNKYYNLATGAYERFIGEHFHLYIWEKGKTKKQAIVDFNNMILADGKINSKNYIIDLGCGIGSLSLLIYSRYCCDITAVNINKHQLNIARERAKKKKAKINFIENDIMDLSFKEEFNTCFFIDAEPHLPNKHKAIKIVRKLLKHKGRLVMTAWLQSERPTIFQKELLIKPFCRLAAFPFMETFSHYKRYFQKEHFNVIKFEDITEGIKPVVDYYYHFVMDHTSDYKSIKQAAGLVKNREFIGELIKTATKGELLKTAEDIFLGPIYTKLCMDAGVFKLGYFVVEKR